MMLVDLVLSAVSEPASYGSELMLQRACRDAADGTGAMHRADNAVSAYEPSQIQAGVKVRISLVVNKVLACWASSTAKRVGSPLVLRRVAELHRLGSSVLLNNDQVVGSASGL